MTKPTRRRCRHGPRSTGCWPRGLAQTRVGLLSTLAGTARDAVAQSNHAHRSHRKTVFSVPPETTLASLWRESRRAATRSVSNVTWPECALRSRRQRGKPEFELFPARAVRRPNQSDLNRAARARLEPLRVATNFESSVRATCFAVVEIGAAARFRCIGRCVRRLRKRLDHHGGRFVPAAELARELR